MHPRTALFAHRSALRFVALAAALIGFLFVLSVGQAGAARPASGVLMGSKPVPWTGGVARAEVPPGEIPECAGTTCDRFDLVVDLPRGIWKGKTGGVAISIGWPNAADNLKLYVYRDGALVAESEAVGASSQSVLIPEAPNGTYRVYAAYDPSSLNDRVFYNGNAAVQRAAR